MIAGKVRARAEIESDNPCMQVLREPKRELTREAARRLDEAAQRRYGIPGIVLMENAARAMAEIARAMLGTTSGLMSDGFSDVFRDDGTDARVVVVCGTGNNGGDGYAIARHLTNTGALVEIVAIGPPAAGGDAAINESICRRMGLVFAGIEALERRPDLVVDAIFGTGLTRPVEGAALEAITAINASRAMVLAVDLPSGLDNDSGLPLGSAVRARVTAVTVAPRPAMRMPDARRWFGRTRIVDIGAPTSLLREFGTVLE